MSIQTVLVTLILTLTLTLSIITLSAWCSNLHAMNHKHLRHCHCSDISSVKLGSGWTCGERGPKNLQRKKTTPIIICRVVTGLFCMPLSQLQGCIIVPVVTFVFRAATWDWASRTWWTWWQDYIRNISWVRGNAICKHCRLACISVFRLHIQSPTFCSQYAAMIKPSQHLSHHEPVSKDLKELHVTEVHCPISCTSSVIVTKQ